MKGRGRGVARVTEVMGIPEAGYLLRHSGARPKGASPESITTIGSMDSGLALRAPRNDVGGAYVISFFRISAKRSRQSLAEILPSIACWISGTPSESILPPQPG